MGLDTIEIIVQIENCFDVVITDEEAVRTYTVGDIADLIYMKKKIEISTTDIFRVLYFKLKELFVNNGVNEKIICVNTELTELIPQGDLKFYEKLIKKQLDLLPPPIKLKYNLPREEGAYQGLIIKIFKRNKQLRSYTLAQYIHFLISVNYKKLLNPNHLHSRYEAERIVCMIVSDCTGIPVSKIELHYKIVEDLGIE
ncbi:hypothetical protein [Apibacter sp. HY039]|uniref:hypothetical protein n=1 Tax=Apibacter sp. HY039 TaxID=2501476 RepID=UPI000FEBF5B8|nr:hypothetical protein [Apibacter sp. HY039]